MRLSNRRGGRSRSRTEPGEALFTCGRTETLGRDVVTLEVGGYRTARHHHSPVCDLDDLLVVRRDDENSDPLRGKPANRAIDLCPGSDVHAAGRLDEDENPRPRLEPPSE